MTMRTLRPGHAIRPALAADVPGLPAIEREAAARFRDVGIDGAFLEGTTPEDDLLAAAHDGSLLVATSEGAVVGFALWTRLDETTAWLEEVDVATAHGGLGLGRALVLAVIEVAAGRGASCVGLRTFRDVPWNAPFYARLGFRVVEGDPWTPAVAAMVAGEEARGLPRDRRCTMRFDLDY